ncbi:hypothetical protein POSPLADRAFT_1076405 [Postia placenta MAD-698-R-SB12]|uniref:Uncharacterized protein n=1 Tax=Postia placenta MAD-698-R-SB12 TaxID=670580 RepID=A0A1X6MLI8_9APHY|nr:hypothetical protein POSPLADRAFT_1076405 [Postia placenta MAD-698-R-SB12]OSX57235.1 hypothetical protein POSPLADRAFT_1076405 [Postia placenta MAD-698-R-SB12]
MSFFTRPTQPTEDARKNLPESQGLCRYPFSTQEVEMLSPHTISLSGARNRNVWEGNTGSRNHISRGIRTQQQNDRAQQAHTAADIVSFLPASSFNPLAEPFVPGASRMHTLAATPVPQPSVQQTSAATDASLVIRYDWLPSLRLGLAAVHPESRRVLAQSIVRLKPWARDPVRVAILSAKIAKCVIEGHYPNMTTVAQFSSELDKLFRREEGGQLAMYFRRCLELYLCRCFAEYCYPLCQQPHEIYSMRAPVRSRDGEVTCSRIESALALAAYAGGLFAQDMIPGSLALTCLNALVSQPYVLEHLQAIHALLSHAGQKLCKAGSPDYWDSISSVSFSSYIVMSGGPTVRVTEWENEPEPVPMGQGVRWTSDSFYTQPTWVQMVFDNFATGLDIQPRGDERNVREVEDLRAVRERERPELGRRAEDVDEALAVARADLGPIGNADKVVMNGQTASHSVSELSVTADLDLTLTSLAH